MQLRVLLNLFNFDIYDKSEPKGLKKMEYKALFTI